MYYLVSLAYLLLHSFHHMLRNALAHGEAKRTGDSVAHSVATFSSLVIVLGTLLYSIPMMLTLLSPIGEAQPLGDDIISPGMAVGALALGGGMLLAAIVAEAGMAIRHKVLGFWKTGHLLMTGLAASIALVGAYHHFSFVGDNTGIVNLAAFSHEVGDIECQSGFLMVNWDQVSTAPIEYRCPTSLVLLTNEVTPFLPWPSYETGRSEDLSKALNRMAASAERVHD